ncbi:MAG: C-GCAxxG-C-C family (seleno)protein [Acidobacteriota bacterium]
MELNKKIDLNRRDFMFSASGILAGICFRSPLGRLYTPFDQKKELAEELSEKEAEIVKKSSMAKDLMNYFSRGYSCAESILMVSLNFMDLPDKHVWAACGFGGGMGKKDLCGMLTGGFMGLGFAAGEIGENRNSGKSKCSAAVNEYWKWWQSQAPLKCENIRTPGTSSKVCVRLGKLAAAKTQSLIEEMKAK